MAPMDLTAKQIIFTGRVQGVGFRFAAHRIANHCCLTGHVRNLPDGSVEMIAQGRHDDIQNCIEALSDSFPYGIVETKIQEIPADPQIRDFKITF